MDMFQSHLLFIVNELKKLEIHLSPDEYFKIKSKNSWSYALIGDLHARKMWENLPIQSIPEDKFSTKFYGREDLTAYRLFNNEDNCLEDAIKWRPDFAVLVCGSNDLLRNEDVNSGSFFSDRILRIYQRLQRNNITCFVISMGERYENSNNDTGKSVFKEGSVITQSVYHNRSSSTNRALKDSLPKGRYINWPSDCRPVEKYCDGVHLYPEGYCHILNLVGTSLKIVTQQTLTDECDEVLSQIQNKNLELEDDIMKLCYSDDGGDDDYDHNVNTELSNQLENRISSPKLCKGRMPQSDHNDNSDSEDDDLDDLFSDVAAELTAAENNDKDSQADFSNEEYINNKETIKSKDCLSDDDISDDCIALDYEIDIDSDFENQDFVDKNEGNVSDLKAKTTDTTSSDMKLSDEKKSKDSKILDSDTELQEKREAKSTGNSFLQQKLIEEGVLNKDPFVLKNSTLNEVKQLTFGHVLGVISLGLFKEKNIKGWINRSMGLDGEVVIPALRRVCHHLICKVPSELAVEWEETLKKKFEYQKQEDGMGKKGAYKTLFGENDRFINFINATKKDFEYIDNECKAFIHGGCCRINCKQYHICSKNNLCILYPKSHDITTTRGESKKLKVPNSETEKHNQKGNECSLEEKKREDALIKSGIIRKSEAGTFMCMKNKCKYASRILEGAEKHVDKHQKEDLRLLQISHTKKQSLKDENLAEHQNEELDNIQPQHSASSVHSRLGPQSGSSKLVIIKSRPAGFKKIKKDDLLKCLSTFGKVTDCNLMQYREGTNSQVYVEFENAGAAAKAVKQARNLHINGTQLKVHGIVGNKVTELTEEQFKIPGMCHKYNAKGYCTSSLCTWPHNCSECGGKHPLKRCRQRNQKETEKDDSEKPGDDSVEEEGINKRSRSSNECSSNSPLKDNEFDMDDFFNEDDSNSDNDSDDEGSSRKKCKFESERFASSSKDPSNLSLKDEESNSDEDDKNTNNDSDDEESKVPSNSSSKVEESASVGVSEKGSKIKGMCNAYNNTGKCHHKQCWHPHRCDLCGGEHPRFRCGSNLIDSGKETGENEKGLGESVAEAILNFREKHGVVPKIAGMCNLYNDCGSCHLNVCRLPHKCNECGGEHPRTRCPPKYIQKGNEKGENATKKMKIPGMCRKYNFFKCYLKHCKYPHRCDMCGGEHRRKDCIEKGRDRSLIRDSRSRSPSNHMTRDESPHWQHQPPSLPTTTVQHQTFSVLPPQIPNQSFSLPPPSIKNQSFSLPPPQIQNQSFALPPPPIQNQSFSLPPPSLQPPQTVPSSYQHVSQNAYQSSYSNVSQNAYDHPKMANTSDINKSLLSGVVEKVAKLTFNKDTLVIIELLQNEMENLGIPSKMETIGKLILEISEKQESMLSGVVAKVANVTLNKDTFIVIEQIKNELERFGIPATMDMIGKLVLEISEKHENMNSMKGKQFIDYGHGSSNYGQPNWNQSSGIPSQQSMGDMYQSSGSIHQGNAWLQSSGGGAEPNRSGMSYQQSFGNIGNMSGQNVGSGMMYHNQWSQGP